MTSIMDICETYHDDEGCLRPHKCALNEEPSNARCVSIESDLSIDLPSSFAVTGSYSDFFDEYDIYPTVLGSGSYGCVRECLHRSTGEKYAVKTIDKSKAHIVDIQKEIQLLQSIDHPGLMRMVDCYEDADYVHIVTERYTGGELFDKIVDNTTNNGCFPEEQAAKIIKSLLEAVQYLHSKDIVHRDIKPENVLFETNEEGSSIKLIDFGLSRVHGISDPPMSSKVGTLYYMSPGVLKGKYDRSCDLWSVGVIAYILLCGYPPFNGSYDDDVQRSIIRGNLEFERAIWENLSYASRDFVRKMLCMDVLETCTTGDVLQHPWIVGA
eukprot:CAMPEP_0183706574 /NCGR_PEP_ID=MMETSP0737-20130205/3347_1 /TAXON_ID=385413 /ORGANISM="Thalassiosira miniscula, Strain CCMP1093" /LENGTH=324 /DNA_ID=CAMNT_0025933999 /DNA_START=126 /DNA_END=1100 /DNA_ORIENTATION=+